MKKTAKIIAIVLVLGLVAIVAGCSLVDTALVGSWTDSWGTMTFTSSGQVTGYWAELFAIVQLGTNVYYSASNGTGQYWADGLLGGTKIDFTYSISGDTLTTDIFFTSQWDYTRA